MGILSRLLFGWAPRRIEHPVFGEALLMKTKLGSYWEVETEVAGARFSVGIDTIGEKDPSQAQVDFFRRYAENPDLAFQRCAALLVPEYENWVGEPFPADWREGFKFEGMSVPLCGDEQNPWDLSFKCLRDRNHHLFTCWFERDVPPVLSIDG